MNLCRSCGKDFTSVEYFDRHRVGRHEYVFRATDPDTHDGRRCLSEHELRTEFDDPIREKTIVMGWEQDTQGRWYDPARSSRASRGLGGHAEKPEEVVEDAEPLLVF